MRARDLLRDGDFRRFWTGATVSRLGSSVSGVATPLVALEVLDASALVVTLLTAALWLPWLVIGLPAGVWVDRLPQRAVMVVCDAVSAVLLLSVPLAVVTGTLTEVQLVAVQLSLGVCGVFFSAAYAGYLPALVGQDALVPANALLHGSDAASQVVGPGLAGLLAGAVGAVGGVVADAGSYAVSLVQLLRIRRPATARPTAPRRRLVVEMAEGVRFVAHDRWLRCLVLHGATSNLPLTGLNALLVVFLVREVGLSATQTGLLLALSGVGGVAGASVTQALSRRVGTARALVLCKAGVGPFALLVPLAAPGPRAALVAVGMLAVTGGIIAGNVVSSSFRQAYCPPAMLGRVMTSMQIVNLGTIPLGAVAAGALATATDVRTAVAVMAVAYALSGLVLVRGLRGQRDLPGPRVLQVA